MKGQEVVSGSRESERLPEIGQRAADLQGLGDRDGARVADAPGGADAAARTICAGQPVPGAPCRRSAVGAPPSRPAIVAVHFPGETFVALIPLWPASLEE
eukprot:3629402-Prymnesium_polylepis.2